ncbi:MAG TPA: hypothetical protein VI585_20945 [Candidatus Binatia bacterium]
MEKSFGLAHKESMSVGIVLALEKSPHSARQGVNLKGEGTRAHSSIGSLVLGNDLPTFPDVYSKTRRLKTSSTNKIIAFARKGFPTFRF